MQNIDTTQPENSPDTTFTRTKIAMTGETTMDVTGDLTMHGITKPVVFAAGMTLNGEHPLGANTDYYERAVDCDSGDHQNRPPGF